MNDEPEEPEHAYVPPDFRDLYDLCPAWLFCCLKSKHWAAFERDPPGWQRQDKTKGE